MKCDNFHIKNFCRVSTALFLFLLTNTAFAQQSGIPLLDSLLTAGDYSVADSNLQSQIETLQNAGNSDSLAHYPYYVGRIEQHRSNTNQAVIVVRGFVNT